MIAVLTQDPSVVQWCYGEHSNTALWGRLEIVSACGESIAAARLRRVLLSVGEDEPVCILGQGDGAGIGSIGQPWSSWRLPFDRIAAMLAVNLPLEFTAPMMIRDAGTGQSELAHRIARWLGRAGYLQGARIYGDAVQVPVGQPVPDPAALAGSSLLTEARVRWTAACVG